MGNRHNGPSATEPALAPAPAPGPAPAPALPADRPVIGSTDLSPVWTSIGSGGFGQVYKAKQLRLGWEVAIKLIFEDGAFEDEDLLFHEAELMRRADNPYVIRVESFFKGSRPGSAIIELGMVMSLMENGSLYALQEKLDCLPPWPLVFQMAHQVALGMNYLHGLTPALIHKDLKAANILLDTALHVKITDFGLARFDNVRTVPACTPYYAPPEASEHMSGGATCAYDVYSYGILLWIILNTGQRLFPFQCVNEERPPLGYINGLLNANENESLDKLVKLMKWCWSQQKEDRPSFRECTAETEPLYEMNKPGIPQAVFQVKMDLNRPVVPPVPAGSTNREDFLKHSRSLSMDPSTVNNTLSLSVGNRKVTYSEQDQHHYDSLDRFTHHTQVLSSNRLPKRCYFEVKWRDRFVSLAISYRDISRNESGESGFGRNDKSWMLYRSCNKFQLRHKGINTASRVSGDDDDDDDGGVFGVYVGHTEGTVSFYSVSNNNVMSLLHTVQTDVNKPLYAGIFIPDSGTAEVCDIW